jgi:hypothetical protein
MLLRAPRCASLALLIALAACDRDWSTVFTKQRIKEMIRHQGEVYKWRFV